MGISKEQAMTEQEFHVARPGNRNGCEVWRRNGATKVWVTRPEDFRVPIKWGLYHYGYLTPDSAVEWEMHTLADCPVIGTAKCPKCEWTLDSAIRPGKADNILACPNCGWQSHHGR